MKVGIPKGLLYYKYYPFIHTFLEEIGAEIIVSEDTNKRILDKGVKYAVDEVCLPMKIFHGHVDNIKDKCDLIIVPRIMCIRDREYICPKFCGLPEMIKNSIPDMPDITELPLYINSEKSLHSWCKKLGLMICRNIYAVDTAYIKALAIQGNFKQGLNEDGYDIKLALLGHPYNVYDNFINMNLIEKLHKFGAGVITEEFVSEVEIDREVNKLFKRPFWSFARNSYGAAATLFSKKKVDGIIYISSFACGIDSVVIELIKNRIGDFPFLVLKVDEQTGEAGFNTRIEAFIDMIERGKMVEGNISTYGERIYCS
ncbi:MAG: 2-hydroxyglutaryl-CoA dehydratase [Clostridium thermopalmarium]|uniref:acyl-CoA dehydratase activase-related protein n=1 Tax=Clostridium thermopalmarium TaxID=29373 RepID=UPI002353A7CE|nr:acyl-CoA dehydratase activase-related protein [Clostridium thermopalmarium]MBE6043872.1 2-hydroxyglutaryl-CoA dehydratase [Clostridium thermopalmarium]